MGDNGGPNITWKIYRGDRNRVDKWRRGVSCRGRCDLSDLLPIERERVRILEIINNRGDKGYVDILDYEKLLRGNRSYLDDEEMYRDLSGGD